MKEMMNTLGIFGTVGAGLILIAFMIAGAQYFLKPFNTMVDNKTFKESQQYNDGMIRDLQNLKMEYVKGTPEQKAALKSIIVQRFSVYPEDKLPTDLQAFYNSIKG